MAALSARYFRLYCYNAPGSYFRIGELEIHATVGGATICSGGTAFGNGDYYPASRAFNGTATGETNVWAGNPGNGRTVGYDFGSVVTMSECVITNGIGMGSGEGQHKFSFDFQYSNDGSTWTTLFSVPNSARDTTGGASYTYPLETFLLAGAVLDASGGPVARRIVAMREDARTVIGSAISDALTGAYSIEATAAVPHTLVAYPSTGDGLPALVLSGVVPV